jgi:formyltetrahydrofolate hydrolase
MLQRRGKNIGRAVLAARAAGVQAGDRVHVHENGTIIHA